METDNTLLLQNFSAIEAALIATTPGGKSASPRPPDRVVYEVAPEDASALVSPYSVIEPDDEAQEFVEIQRPSKSGSVVSGIVSEEVHDASGIPCIGQSAI
jgi:hypothetical protein